MAKFEVQFQPQAWKDLDELPERDARRVYQRILLLADNLAGDVKKLRQHQPAYRLRVGDWRILFDVLKNRVIVLRILNRRDAYG